MHIFLFSMKMWQKDRGNIEKVFQLYESRINKCNITIRTHRIVQRGIFKIYNENFIFSWEDNKEITWKGAYYINTYIIHAYLFL